MRLPPMPRLRRGRRCRNAPKYKRGPAAKLAVMKRRAVSLGAGAPNETLGVHGLAGEACRRERLRVSPDGFSTEERSVFLEQDWAV